eukprot:Opistho-2@25290
MESTELPRVADECQRPTNHRSAAHVDVADLVAQLTSARTTADEALALEELLCAFGDDGCAVPEELAWASLPTPVVSVCQLLRHQVALDLFVCYVFERRFGWSEWKLNAALGGNATLALQRDSSGQPITSAGDLHPPRTPEPCPLSPLSPPSKKDGADSLLQLVPPRMDASGARTKRRLNDLLDRCVAYLRAQAPEAPLLVAFEHCITEVAAKPVVRNQTYVHLMEWFRQCGQSEDLRVAMSANAAVVERLVVQGLTDVWSAIRSGCMSRVGGVLDVMDLTQLERFYSALVAICMGPGSTWQAKEGALMGITAVVRKFAWTTWEGTAAQPSAANADAAPTQGPKYLLKFGRLHLDGLPPFISNRIRGVVYSLLAHPQLSIREHATKAFSAYLSRSEFREALTSLKEVVGRLAPHGLSFSPSGVTGDGTDNIHPALAAPFQFMDAYEAEGLLSVCVYLIKHIPPRFLLPNWPHYFRTFDVYLMHPASTVRQVTSTLFKHLVAKDCHNPALLKLIVQSLAADWETNTRLLSLNTDDDMCEASECAKSDPAMVVESTPAAPGSKASTVHHRIGVVDLLARATGSEPLHPSFSWEWREGRLFAYELLLKLIVANHIQYVFPSLDAVRRPQSAVPSSPSTATQLPLDVLEYIRESDEATDMQTPIRNNATVPGRGRLNTHSMGNAPFNVDAMSLSHSSSLMVDVTAPSPGGSMFNSPMLSRRTSALPHDSPVPHADTRLKQELLLTGGSPDYESVPVPGAGLLRIAHLSKSETNVAAVGIGIGIGSAPLRSVSPSKVPSASPSLISQLHNLDGGALWGAASQSVPSVADLVESGRVSLSLIGDRDAAANHPPPAQQGLLFSWLSDVHLEHFGLTVRALVLHVAECVGDARWELRRMADQVLPVLAEAVCWYDVAILGELWRTLIPLRCSVLSYVAVIMLRHAAAQRAKLVHLASHSRPAWLDAVQCRRAATKLSNVLVDGLSVWLEDVLLVVETRPFDKMSMVCTEVVMTLLSQLFDDLSVEQRHRMAAAVEARLSRLADFADGKGASEFVCVTEGYLSCGVKVSSAKGRAQHCERVFLGGLHPLLPDFAAACEPSEMLRLIPILSRYACRSTDAAASRFRHRCASTRAVGAWRSI